MLSDIAAQVVDSVVSIGVWQAGASEVHESGSGVVIEPGVVVTNYHVVEGAQRIQVADRLGTPFAATLVGTDQRSDLAVVRVEGAGANQLPPIDVGDASQLRLGDWVLAVGNPFGLGSTVTAGIISAVGRARLGIAEDEDFLQTDAAINPGNSGGALVNTRGELVGINTAIASKTGGNHGVGFAIPVQMAIRITNGILVHGHFTRGWLGADVQERPATYQGDEETVTRPALLVTAVRPGSPADQSGLLVGDVILGLDGFQVMSSRRLRTLVSSSGAGTDVQLELLRNNQRTSISVTLQATPTPLPGQTNSDAPTGPGVLH